MNPFSDSSQIRGNFALKVRLLRIHIHNCFNLFVAVFNVFLENVSCPMMYIESCRAVIKLLCALFFLSRARTSLESSSWFLHIFYSMVNVIIFLLCRREE